MTTHRIRAREPVYVLREFTLDDDGGLAHLGSADADAPVEGLEAEREYECTCGEEFDDDLEAAWTHLEEIEASPNGEAITAAPPASGSPVLSIEHRSKDDDRPGAKLTWELSRELATRVWIEAQKSELPCSNQLAWAANWAMKKAFRNDEAVVSFDFYTRSRGWQSNLINIFERPLNYTDGPHEEQLAAVKDEIEAL